MRIPVRSLIALLSLAFAGAAAGQELDRDEVQRWFDDAWSAAQSLPDLGDNSVEWTLELVYVPPADELDRLRRSVEGRPDHPERYQLEAYERRRKGDHEVLRRRLWSRGDGQWRWNQDMGETGFSDAARTEKHEWSMNTDTLVVEDRRSGEDELESPIAGRVRAFWPELSRMLHGNFSSGSISGLTPQAVQLRGDRWRVNAHTSEQSDDGRPSFAQE